MKTAGRAAAALVVLLSAVAAGAQVPGGVPLPQGWIGTTSEWIRGFGIAFARTIERMQSHPGANISRSDLDRITASLLVVRCARCHNEETLGLMVLKTEPERLATIRRMAALPGSGVRPDQAPALARAFEQLFSQ